MSTVPAEAGRGRGGLASRQGTAPKLVGIDMNRFRRQAAADETFVSQPHQQEEEETQEQQLTDDGESTHIQQPSIDATHDEMPDDRSDSELAGRIELSSGIAMGGMGTGTGAGSETAGSAAEPQPHPCARQPYPTFQPRPFEPPPPATDQVQNEQTEGETGFVQEDEHEHDGDDRFHVKASRRTQQSEGSHSEVSEDGDDHDVREVDESELPITQWAQERQQEPVEEQELEEGSGSDSGRAGIRHVESDSDSESDSSRSYHRSRRPYHQRPLPYPYTEDDELPLITRKDDGTYELKRRRDGAILKLQPQAVIQDEPSSSVPMVQQMRKECIGGYYLGATARFTPARFGRQLESPPPPPSLFESETWHAAMVSSQSHHWPRLKLRDIQMEIAQLHRMGLSPPSLLAAMRRIQLQGREQHLVMYVEEVQWFGMAAQRIKGRDESGSAEVIMQVTPPSIMRNRHNSNIEIGCVMIIHPIVYPFDGRDSLLVSERNIEKIIRAPDSAYMAREQELQRQHMAHLALQMVDASATPTQVQAH